MKKKIAEPVQGLWVKEPYLPTETEIWEGTRRIAKVHAGIIGLSEVETADLLASAPVFRDLLCLVLKCFDDNYNNAELMANDLSYVVPTIREKLAANSHE